MERSTGNGRWVRANVNDPERTNQLNSTVNERTWTGNARQLKNCGTWNVN